VSGTNIGFPGPFVGYQLEQYVFWERIKDIKRWILI
jgi:hypothetical protein